MAAPLANSNQSPDSLPPVGYTIDQLAAYIRRRLGEPVFAVEITNQQVLDCINDALRYYSLWRPRIMYAALALQRSQNMYLQGVDMGLGPVQVSFVQRTPIPQELFWGNLIDVAPLQLTGMDEYDMFLRWQKTWARVTSVQPDWAYDEINKVLMIHNPIERFFCGVVAYVSYTDVINLDRYGADWVSRYAFERARLSYSEIMSKFSGAIPGPVKDLTFDQSRREKAEAAVATLEAALRAAQVSTPLQID